MIMAEILSSFIWLLTWFSKQNKIMKSVWNYVFIYYLSDIVFHVLGWKRSIMWALQIPQSHMKNDNNNFWTMCVTHEAKWMGTASTLMSSKIIPRDILMMMKWRRNEKQTAPFHPDGLTGALTETPGADWPSSKWHVGFFPENKGVKRLSFQHQPLKHFSSGLLSFPIKKV